MMFSYWLQINNNINPLPHEDAQLRPQKVVVVVLVWSLCLPAETTPNQGRKHSRDCTEVAGKRRSRLVIMMEGRIMKTNLSLEVMIAISYITAWKNMNTKSNKQSACFKKPNARKRMMSTCNLSTTVSLTLIHLKFIFHLFVKRALLLTIQFYRKSITETKDSSSLEISSRCWTQENH